MLKKAKVVIKDEMLATSSQSVMYLDLSKKKTRKSVIKSSEIRIS